MKTKFIKEVEVLLKLTEKYNYCTILIHDWRNDREKMKEIREYFGKPFHIGCIESGPYMAVDLGSRKNLTIFTDSVDIDLL